MLKKLKANSRGFTIIEVMIVLAVAALIILIVLLAVPALQRSSRNTTIKNDASSLAAGISDFESNNDGSLPTKFSFTNGNVTLANASISTGAQAKIQGSDTIEGQATGASNYAFATTPPTSTNAKAGELWVVTGESCDLTPSTRAISIYYWTETPGVTSSTTNPNNYPNATGLTGQCLDT